MVKALDLRVFRTGAVVCIIGLAPCVAHAGTVLFQGAESFSNARSFAAVIQGDIGYTAYDLESVNKTSFLPSIYTPGTTAGAVSIADAKANYLDSTATATAIEGAFASLKTNSSGSVFFQGITNVSYTPTYTPPNSGAVYDTGFAENVGESASFDFQLTTPMSLNIAWNTRDSAPPASDLVAYHIYVNSSVVEYIFSGSGSYNQTLPAGNYELGFDDLANDTSGIPSPTAGSQFGAFSFSITDTATVLPIPVAALPEPSQWTMMLIGLGLIGSALRNMRYRSNNRSICPH